MANFAEKLAYWYLRLNGCLLIENYVHHRRPGQDAADSDLLAVRLRHAAQRVGTEVPLPDDWEHLFSAEIVGKHVALVVQVKGGAGAVGDAFSAERLRDALCRIGSFGDAEVDQVVQSLSAGPHAMSGEWLAIKLLVGPTRPRDTGRCHYISLQDAHSFVRNRFRTFADPKGRDWMYFPDDLVQLIAWEERIAAETLSG